MSLLVNMSRDELNTLLGKVEIGEVDADTAFAELTARSGQTQSFDSASSQRTANNLMRHNYRVLNETEKLHMQELKDAGLEFVKLLHRVGGTLPDLAGVVVSELPERQSSRELSVAQTKIEEAVMWAVKHVTR